MQLEDLSDRELIALGKALRAPMGFGKDPARMSKADKVAYVRTLGTDEQVRKHIAALAIARPAQQADEPQQAEAKPEHRKVSDLLGPDLAKAVRALAHDETAHMLEAFKAPACSHDDEPRRVTLSLGALPDVDCSDKHPVFPKVLALAAHTNIPVLLVGPAGCGKTTLADHVAQALGKSFAFMSCSAGVTESALLGRLLPTGQGGTFSWVTTPFVETYAKGGVFLLDEVDAADANLLVTINSALANGHLSVETRAACGLDAIIPRHARTTLLMAANTYGTGADAQYVGRSQLDAAFLDRVIVIEMGYDKALEARLCGVKAPAQKPWEPSAPLDASLIAKDLADFHGWHARLSAHVAARGIQRIVSTRMLLKARALRSIGCDLDEVKRTVLAGWRADETAGLL